MEPSIAVSEQGQIAMYATGKGRFCPVKNTIEAEGCTRGEEQRPNVYTRREAQTGSFTNAASACKYERKKDTTSKRRRTRWLGGTFNPSWIFVTKKQPKLALIWRGKKPKNHRYNKIWME